MSDMAANWGGWGARLNVTSIVSQGLEQVSKLREDVEKQFDQAVLGSKATKGVPALDKHDASTAEPSSLLFPPPPTTEANASAVAAADITPPLQTVDDIRVIKSTAPWVAKDSKLLQPPYSEGGKRRGSSIGYERVQTPPAVAEDTPVDGEEAKYAEIQDANAADEHEEKLAAPGTTASSEDNNVDESTATHNAEEENESAIVDQETSFESVAEQEEIRTIANAVDDSEVDEDELGEIGDLQGNEKSEENCENEDDNAQQIAHEQEDLADIEPEEVQEIEAEVIDKNDDENSEERTEEIAIEQLDVAKTGTAPNATDIQEKEAILESLRRELQQRETQLLAMSATITELHDELDKTCQREVTAVERARFLTEQLELMRHEVAKLNRMATGQRDSELQALHVAVTEKDEQLKALLDEGQALSVKQAQMEQRLRQLRKEKNEEEERRLKAQSQYETVQVQFEELMRKVKATEESNAKNAQELRQTQIALERTTKQLSQSEQELSSASKQVETLQAQVRELTESNQVLRDEMAHVNDRNQSNEGLHAEKSELEETIRFLQRNIADVEKEAIRHEEMSRAEIADLKKKWQGAVNRVDMMGHSVSEATQPLLRQIHALQEDLRGRQEAWKVTEATLLQRIQEGSEQRRQIELERLQHEEKVHQLQTAVDAFEHDLQRKQSEITREKDKLDIVQQNERELRAQLHAVQIEMDEVKLRLQAEVCSKQLLVKTQEEHMRKRMQERVENVNTEELEKARERETQLRHDLEWHQAELLRVKALANSNPNGGMHDSHGPPSNGSTSSLSLSQLRKFGDSNSSLLDESPSQASILRTTLESNVEDTRLGSTSMLGLSQLQQRLRLREGENRLLKQQMTDLEEKQKQTTDDIVRLSTRNALLEASAAQFQQTQNELVELRQRQHVLLELFGEKEEQVEELQSEIGELKAFYRKQLDTLASHHQH